MPDQPFLPNQQNRTYPRPDDFVTSTTADDPAVDMIRQKIHSLYAEEPDAAQEAVEAVQHTHPGSKHQRYMNELQASGMSLTEVQSAWHIYYSGLPDSEKYEVWQEFYAREQPAQPTPAQQPAVVQPRPAAMPAAHELRQRSQRRKTRQRRGRAERLVAAAVSGEGVAAVKKHLLNSIKTAGGTKLTAKHHLQSLLFGLGFGGLVVFIFLFGFFNQLVIAPLLQPSRKANDTPVIVNTASVVVDGNKVIIPKINLEIPVDYSQTTTSESAIELALDNGVVHYPTTVKPGQIGNAAFFGHSSNNIFNPGKYKFAFAFLHTLVAGDTFYLSRDGTTYAYKVFSSRVVSPKEVGVLKPIAGHSATATLITCDPPGTSINRLVVVGDQISPDPNTNGQPETQTASATTSTAGSALPGNGPSLWSRLISSIF